MPGFENSVHDMLNIRLSDDKLRCPQTCTPQSRACTSMYASSNIRNMSDQQYWYVILLEQLDPRVAGGLAGGPAIVLGQDCLGEHGRTSPSVRTPALVQI